LQNPTNRPVSGTKPDTCIHARKRTHLEIYTSWKMRVFGRILLLEGSGNRTTEEFHNVFQNITVKIKEDEMRRACRMQGTGIFMEF
jgi:hypothetical protein